MKRWCQWTGNEWRGGLGEEVVSVDRLSGEVVCVKRWSV